MLHAEACGNVYMHAPRSRSTPRPRSASRTPGKASRWNKPTRVGCSPPAGGQPRRGAARELRPHGRAAVGSLRLEHAIGSLLWCVFRVPVSSQESVFRKSGFGFQSRDPPLSAWADLRACPTRTPLSGLGPVCPAFMRVSSDRAAGLCLRFPARASPVTPSPI